MIGGGGDPSSLRVAAAMAAKLRSGLSAHPDEIDARFKRQDRELFAGGVVGPHWTPIRPHGTPSDPMGPHPMGPP